MLPVEDSEVSLLGFRRTGQQSGIYSNLQHCRGAPKTAATGTAACQPKPPTPSQGLSPPFPQRPRLKLLEAIRSCDKTQLCLCQR